MVKQPEYIDRVCFKIPGEPKGKGRPRFARAGNYVRTYTPDETVSYENLIKVEYQRQCRDKFYFKGTPLSATVVAYYSIPSSTSKKKKKLMLDGQIRPIKKVDVDNLLKVIFDSLNGVAYADDIQIVECTVYKYFAQIPRVEVSLAEVLTLPDGEDYPEQIDIDSFTNREGKS